MGQVWGIAKALIVSMRPRQWYKNLIIYLAFFFTIDEAWSLDSDVQGALGMFGVITLAFLIFSGLTGAVYIVNDVLDAESDRRHPRKRHRPIASGRLGVPMAWGTAAVLSVVGLGAAVVLEPAFGALSALYVVANLAYSVALKHIVLVDVFVISGGMVLRAVAGAAIMEVPIFAVAVSLHGACGAAAGTHKTQEPTGDRGRGCREPAAIAERVHGGVTGQARHHHGDGVAHRLLAVHIHRAQPAGQRRDDADDTFRGVRTISLHYIEW